MWFISPTEQWLDEVIRSINEKQLDPEKSWFMMAFFSSMDYEIVQYFKAHKAQISSYSGQNFHIFTPFIYHDDLVPDDEVRAMTREFRQMGIPITSNPTFVFFKLQKKYNSYQPIFFAGFELHSFDKFHVRLKRIIDSSVGGLNTRMLVSSLTHIFESPNIIKQDLDNNELKKVITEKLPSSKIFISHSSQDKPFVRKLINALSSQEGLHYWLDEKEIKAGDDIQQSVSKNLKNSDFLIAVISRNSVNSKWVNFELSQYMGFAGNKNIIPVLLEKEQQFPEPIDNLIRRLKYLDFSDEKKWFNNINELMEVIANKRRFPPKLKKPNAIHTRHRSKP